MEFKSDKIIDYTFPADKQHQGLNGVIVGPLALKDADKPYIEPLVEVAKPEPPKETAAPKKVAQDCANGGRPCSRVTRLTQSLAYSATGEHFHRPRPGAVVRPPFFHFWTGCRAELLLAQFF